MAEFSVNTDSLRTEANALRSLQRELSSTALQMSLIRISSAMRNSSTQAMNSRVRDCCEAVSNHAANLGALSSGLEEIANLYDRVEKNLSDPKTSAQNEGGSGSSSDDKLWDWSSVFENIIENVIDPTRWTWEKSLLLLVSPATVLGGMAYYMHGNLVDLLGDGGSLYSGELSGSGSVGGIPCSGKLSGGLLGYDVGTTAEAEWNIEKGNAGLKLGGKLSGYVAEGGASGNIGILGGSAKGSVGNAAVSGSVNATLFDHGEFAPSVGIEAKADASVLKGKAEGYLGSQDNNVHVKGSGTVLGAGAKAEAKAGVITIEDEETGKMKTVYGAKVGASAEAYLAEGKVSGGFSIFGMDIDVGISGKAGGAGAKAEGTFTSGGFSGEVGAGLGLGAGVKISVDWSDFDPPSLEEIGDGLVNAGEAVKDFFSW